MSTSPAQKGSLHQNTQSPNMTCCQADDSAPLFKQKQEALKRGEAVKLSGAEMLVQSLIEEDVKHIFGYPGGSVLHIYDALFKQDDIEHILVRHEQAAGHMADAYSRVTNKVGVVLATSGPGATNTITAIATAYMDSIPMLVLTGQVPTTLIGDDAFQECDVTGVSRPIVKHSFQIRDPRDIPSTIKKAFYLAKSGRPGPVLIDIPKDMTAPEKLFEYNYPKEVDIRGYQPTEKGHAGQIRRAAQAMVKAKCPVVYTGGGVVLGHAHEELRALLQIVRAPITNTLMGLGGFDGTDERFLGMLGMHGTYEANMTMHHADLILAVGVRFDDRVTNNIQKFCPDATIIHIDIDPASIGKTVSAHIPIVGDVKYVLRQLREALNETLEQASFDTQALDAWEAQVNEWRKFHALRYQDDLPADRGEHRIKPQRVLEILFKLTKGEAIITSDVGQHQMFAALHYKYKRPGQWINSGGLGTMGVGLPYAMGAKIAKPDVPVICITGEGSIQMNIQELSTCAQYGLGIKVLMLNNEQLGMVKQWQDMIYDGRHAQSYMKSLPDFVALAESYGHKGIQITDPNRLEEDLKRALEDPDLVFIDVYVDRAEHVYPMQIAGGAMKDMWLDKGVRTDEQ